MQLHTHGWRSITQTPEMAVETHKAPLIRGRTAGQFKETKGELVGNETATANEEGTVGTGLVKMKIYCRSSCK